MASRTTRTRSTAGCWSKSSRSLLPKACAIVTTLHYSPKARKRSQLDAKLHWNAVTADYLTQSFAQARDDSPPPYDDMPAGERPNFHEIHEIRELGAWLYEQQGFEQEYIQGLMGHADVKMTEHYQAGHGDDAVVYMKVKADLKV